jgi:hypothetical protein
LKMSAEKIVGEPYTGKPYVRFEEGSGQPPLLLDRSLR